MAAEAQRKPLPAFEREEREKRATVSRIAEVCMRDRKLKNSVHTKNYKAIGLHAGAIHKILGRHPELIKYAPYYKAGFQEAYCNFDFQLMVVMTGQREP